MIIEALASGNVLVSSLAGGLSEALIDRVHGLMLYSKPIDPLEIADKIKKLINKKNKMNTKTSKLR